MLLDRADHTSDQSNDRAYQTVHSMFLMNPPPVERSVPASIGGPTFNKPIQALPQTTHLIVQVT